MIKIYKNTDKNSNLEEIKEIQKDSWINLVNPTDMEIKTVAKQTNIEERLLKEVLVEKDLPRIKKMSNEVLIVIDLPYKTKNGYNTYPLGIIISNDLYIITVSLKDTVLLKRFINNDIDNFYTAKKSRFCIQILEETSKEYLNALDDIEKNIESKEQGLLDSTDNKKLLDLLNINKSLVYFITSLKYNNTVLEKISKEYVIDIFEEDYEFLEDTIIDNKQCIKIIYLQRLILIVL